MSERIKELAEQATNYAKDICIHDPDAVWCEVRDAKFAELVRQDERKACADLAYNCDPRANHRGIAAAIRGRTE